MNHRFSAFILLVMAGCVPPIPAPEPDQVDNGDSGEAEGSNGPPPGRVECRAGKIDPEHLPWIRGAPLDRCSLHPTVEEFERDFLQSRCGKSSQCHRLIFDPKIREGEDIFTRLAGVKSQIWCEDDFYINLDAPLKSYFLTKTQQDEPSCPSDSSKKTGVREPYSTDFTNEVPLDPSETRV